MGFRARFVLCLVSIPTLSLGYSKFSDKFLSSGKMKKAFPE